MVFESTSMRYETLVARFWLRVRGVPQSSCRRQSRDKDKSSGVENVSTPELFSFAHDGQRQSRDKRQELWGREWNNLSSTPFVIFERAAVGF